MCAKSATFGFTPDMDNSKELIEKKGNFIGQANHILTKYAIRSCGTFKCSLYIVY